VRLFTKATAVQHAQEHIRCNSVHPGPIDTPMVRGPQTDPARLAALQERVPMGRLGSAEEVAYGVLYLASDEASFVTGSELVIDGGRTAQ
jgi:NAD(P)-dependent dehydrogenase (short-subunit alcohol dehydrogenase family)